ncbi:acyl-CoA synthetase [Microbacterium sp.]|uniref:acyl-CoA synthetase n=1 Tax=Microbacterium sp. TaxID=51671 RepID=UPI003A843061
MSDTAPRRFEVRHLQLARALFAALAAAMITFSADHSAAVGLSVFSGFAIATGLVFLLSAWLVHPAGRRTPGILLGILCLVAGMASGLPPLRSATLFFAVVITWALASGTAELVSGIVARRRGDTEARDAILIGAITIALGVALLIVNPAYSLEYFIHDAGQWFTLTGTTIGVGLFGGYAAVVAVFLAIAGLSPRRQTADRTTATAGERA